MQSSCLDDIPQNHQHRRAEGADSSDERTIEFCPPALERLSRRSERLNDVTINAGALLLQRLLSHSRFPLSEQPRSCAIFSTFDIHLARYNRPTEEVWRRTKQVKYWQKSIWLFPIHRHEPTQHWVLCIVYPQYRHVLLFDSLASDLPEWQTDIQVSPQWSVHSEYSL